MATVIMLGLSQAEINGEFMRICASRAGEQAWGILRLAGPPNPGELPNGMAVWGSESEGYFGLPADRVPALTNLALPMLFEKNNARVLEQLRNAGVEI